MIAGKLLLLAVVAAAVLIAGTLFVGSVEFGVPRVLDGDTIELGGKRYRLYGVDAFESSQTCLFAGRAWPCGQRAKQELMKIIGTASVSCQSRDRDRYGRTIAVCYRGVTDLGRSMVESGYALAYRQYSGDYIEPESIARSTLKGAWSSTFDAPWLYRQKRKDQAQADADTDGG